MRRFKTVDEYIELSEYSAELSKLREILLSTGLKEELKWSAPCYTYQGKNIVGIGAFKSYFGLWFHQGASLTDPENVLINAQEGKTKALRQWRFTNKKEIKVRTIKAYVKEAIEAQKAGDVIKPDRSKPIVVPPELQQAFNSKKVLQNAFSKFTKGKQREFAEYIAAAKRAETKQKRLEKILPMILDGVGLNDKYRSR